MLSITIIWGPFTLLCLKYIDYLDSQYLSPRIPIWTWIAAGINRFKQIKRIASDSHYKSHYFNSIKDFNILTKSIPISIFTTENYFKSELEFLI